MYRATLPHPLHVSVTCERGGGGASEGSRSIEPEQDGQLSESPLRSLAIRWRACAGLYEFGRGFRIRSPSDVHRRMDEVAPTLGYATKIIAQGLKRYATLICVISHALLCQPVLVQTAANFLLQHHFHTVSGQLTSPVKHHILCRSTVALSVPGPADTPRVDACPPRTKCATRRSHAQERMHQRHSARSDRRRRTSNRPTHSRDHR